MRLMPKFVRCLTGQGFLKTSKCSEFGNVCRDTCGSSVITTTQFKLMVLGVLCHMWAYGNERCFHGSNSNADTSD